MNKKMLFGFLMVVFGYSSVHAQSPRIDSIAVYILQQTSAYLQSIESCSYTAETSYDVWSDELGYIRHSNEDMIGIKFPDKMRLTSSGDKGNRVLLHDGKKLYYYSKNNRQYAVADAPKDVLQTIDTLNKRYGVEFPAADFFYPTFVADLINTGSNLVYLGISKADGKDCFHIAGKNETTGFQFWIDTENNLFLPVKTLITYYDKNAETQQYEATYSNWVLNPNLPDVMFEFVAPPYSTKIQFHQQKTGK